MKRQAYKLSFDEFGVHQKIINWVESGRKVLDVGCASGYLARRLKEKGCLVAGIEIDLRQARKAKKHYRVVVIGDVESLATLGKLGKKKFEVIILADVLEHLKDPGGALKSLTEFLAKDGEVVISVPNIGFLTYRLLHLLGRFEYAEWGIMDKTHLRFFTQKTILDIISGAGLKVEKFDYVGNFTQLPLYMQTLYPILGKKRWWRKLEYKVTGLWPQGLAVQFLLICRKK